MKTIAAARHQSPAVVFAHLRAVGPTAASQRAGDLHRLLVESGVGLGIMTVVAAALGWLVAGRVLRPLRTMTATTRRISEDNLHDRLALQGPRDELQSWATRSMACLPGSKWRSMRSGGLSPTLRTSCVPRWPRCGRRLMSRWQSRCCSLPTSSRSRTGFATSSITSSGCWRALSLARAQHGLVADEFTVALGDIALAAVERRGDDVSRLRLKVRRGAVSGSVGQGQRDVALAHGRERDRQRGLTTTKPGGWVRITAAVDGPAAPASSSRTAADSLPRPRSMRSLEPFRRLGAQRTGSDKGTGLGLSNRRFDRRGPWRNTRSARPRTTVGSFVIALPARRRGARRSASVRVLVAEDSARLANVVVEGLRDAGMAVDVAYDGLDAAAKLNLNPYDVVVLDRDLPGLHGDTICRMIIDSEQPAMILMLTAAGLAGGNGQRSRSGADDYLA